ncbi:MAG: c-type cytochrome [Pseudomonadota bacterium]
MGKVRTISLACAAILCWTTAHALDDGDPQLGEPIFGQCKACHQVGDGAKHRTGPHLNGLFGRVAGSHEDFRYSRAFERFNADGFEWHADTLDTFLENPRGAASGTRMSFRGLKDPQERAHLIAFLRQFSDDPHNIPEADPTYAGVDHDVDPEILALVGDPEYGAYLSGECTACHSAAGDDVGIPSIVLWPEEDFVVAMQEYKHKKRTHPVMQMVAGRLGDEEIASLAAYFANLDQ